jgi:hypothetical protein
MQVFDTGDMLQAMSQILISPFGLTLLAIAAVRIGLDLLLPPMRRGTRTRRQPAGSWRSELVAILLIVTGLWGIGPGFKLALALTTSDVPNGGHPSALDYVFTGLLPFAWAGGITALKRGRGSQDPLERLRALSPGAFEDFVAGLFRKRGYRAEVIGGEGDHGVDIVLANRQGERELVQCKRWDSKWLGEGVVRDFFGAFIHDGDAVHGHIVTTSFFSDAAWAWAAGKPIDLIDGKKLAEAVEVIGR